MERLLSVESLLNMLIGMLCLLIIVSFPPEVGRLCAAALAIVAGVMVPLGCVGEGMYLVGLAVGMAFGPSLVTWWATL